MEIITFAIIFVFLIILLGTLIEATEVDSEVPLWLIPLAFVALVYFMLS